MKEYILLIAGLMFLQGVDCCRTSTDYLTNCVEPFKTYEISDTFWTDICSPQGQFVFQCLETQILNTTCFSYDLDVENLFNNIFESSDYDLDATCEIKTDPACREVTQCFADFVDSRVPETPHLYQFWEFTCGPSYLNRLFNCISSRQTRCPFTTQKQISSFAIITSQSTLSYDDTRGATIQKCGELTSADADCIKVNASELETCGTLPVVDLSEPSIKCDYTDRTTACLNEICGPRVSNFFIDIFKLLRCSREFTACPDDLGIWPITVVDEKATLPCPSECSQGSLFRYCLSGAGWQPVQNNCTLTVDCLPIVDDDNLNTVLERLANITEDQISNPTPELLDSISDLLDEIVDEIDASDNVTVDNFLDVVNNLLRPDYQPIWEETASETDASIADIVEELDEYLEEKLEEESISNQIQTNAVRVTSKDYITVELGRTNDDIIFPSPSIATPGQQDTSKASIEISAEALTDLNAQGSVVYAGSYFDTLGVPLDDDAYINGSFVQSLTINTDVIGVIVLGQSLNFDPPIKAIFQLLKDKFTDPVCVFWDDSITSSGRNGAWSPEGCNLTLFTKTTVTCECDHLTNFAVLMSPSPDSVEGEVLSIISAVGCGISILCLVITIIVHLLVWRLVRSDRAVILMNLCIALLFALIIFLVGINRVESRPVCAAMAALIQFFFLAVFFLMLVMGFEILVCVVHVFGTKFRIKVLVPLAWASAAIVVGISLGVTEAEGYGNNKFCWLDASSGLIWAFIGPVVFVILCNFIIIIVVLHKLATSRVVKSKSKKLQLKTAARSLCVLMPLLGLTWVFGILAINEDLVWMAYAFCIFNSLQGFFIFLMHCVFNTQIRDALKHREQRKQSMRSFSSNFRKQSRSTLVGRNQSISDNSISGPVRQEGFKSSLNEADILARQKRHRSTRR